MKKGSVNVDGLIISFIFIYILLILLNIFSIFK